MNTMMIKIISVEEPQFNKTARGGYNSIEVVYTNKSFQDKVEKRKIMDFTNKEVYKIIASAKKDDIFSISREKDEKGFWQWVDISTDIQTQPAKQEAPSKATPAPKSTYETPEERAKPELLNMSRKKRLAKGAGQDLNQINLFIKQFDQMRDMMFKMTKMPGFGSGKMPTAPAKAGFRRR